MIHLYSVYLYFRLCFVSGKFYYSENENFMKKYKIFCICSLSQAWLQYSYQATRSHCNVWNFAPSISGDKWKKQSQNVLYLRKISFLSVLILTNWKYIELLNLDYADMTSLWCNLTLIMKRRKSVTQSSEFLGL